MKKLFLILVMIGAQVHATDDACRDWFVSSGISPKDRDCRVKCSTHEAGFNEIGCERHCNEYCEQTRKVWIYFGNGMFNTKKEAKDAWKIVNSRIRDYMKGSAPDTYRALPEDQSPQIAYNTDEIWFEQLAQVLEQKQNEVGSDIFLYLSHLNSAPAWFQSITEKMAQEIVDSMRQADPDLERHLTEYRKRRDDGDGVVVVAHSQGNFYYKAAAEVLDRENRGEVLTSVGTVPVATPTDGGILGETAFEIDHGYTTLFSDGVIKFIPYSLPPNTQNHSGGQFDHEFIRHYLNGDVSGPQILRQISCVIRRVRWGVDFDPPQFGEEENPCTGSASPSS